MPYLKFIQGHSKSLKGAADYFEGRDPEHPRCIAWDGINIGHDHDGWAERTWDIEMDEVRKRLGNNTDFGERKARTYQHFIISLDPKDSSVSLDAFRNYCTEWVKGYFQDGKLGNHQAAIIYHDDNKDRIEGGEDGILHAHVIVNNTDTVTGRRIAPKLTRRVINDMYRSLNESALGRGWHGFTEDGRSMTLSQMGELGLNPSRGRLTLEDLAEMQQVDEIPPEERGVVDVMFASACSRIASTTRDEGQKFVPDTNDDLSSRRLSTREESTRKDAGKSGGDGYTYLTFSDGTRYRVRRRNLSTGESIGERELGKRKGHTWKGDLRRRVESAKKLARSGSEFAEILDLLGVGISDSSATGEMKFFMKDQPTRVAYGRTLGRGLADHEILAAIALRKNDYIQRARVRSGMDVPATDSERRAMIGALSSLEPGTREGTSMFDQALRLRAYNAERAISSYEDYPPDETGIKMRVLAHKFGLFDEGATVPLTADQLAALPAEERLKHLMEQRDAKGHGGPTRVATASVPGSAPLSEVERGPERARNISHGR